MVATFIDDNLSMSLGARSPDGDAQYSTSTRWAPGHR